MPGFFSNKFRLIVAATFISSGKGLRVHVLLSKFVIIKARCRLRNVKKEYF